MKKIIVLIVIAVILVFTFFMCVLPFLEYDRYEKNGITTDAKIISISFHDKIDPSTGGTWLYRVEFIDKNNRKITSINYYRCFIMLRESKVDDIIKLMYLPSSSEYFIFKDKKE